MKIHKTLPLFQKGRLRIFQKEIETEQGKVLSRPFFDLPDAVVIAAFLSSSEIVCIQNFRPTIEKPLLELPAGTVDHEEAPLETAKRELEEETGYRAHEWKLLHSYYAMPGLSSRKLHLFEAKGLVKTKQNLDQGEELTVETWSLPALKQAMISGQVEDIKMLSAFPFLYSG